MPRSRPKEEIDLDSLPENFVYQGKEMKRTGRKAVNPQTGSVLIEVTACGEIGEPVKVWAPLRDLFFIE